MSESFIGLFLGIGGFCRGPWTLSSPLCAPPTLILPLGCTVSLSRSRMSGFLDAASTVRHTTSTSSPTFAVAGAVISTLVVPWIAGSPEIGGGTHSVRYAVSAASAGPAAASMPAPASIRAKPPALALLRCLVTWHITWNLSMSEGRWVVQWWRTVRCPG